MVRLIWSRDSTLLSCFQTLLSKGTSVDVRLRCSDHKASDGLGVHKLVLASASPQFLKSLLLESYGNEEMSCIHLPDYEAHDVASVISLLYYGELSFSDVSTLDICRRIMKDLHITVSVSFEDNCSKSLTSDVKIRRVKREVCDSQVMEMKQEPAESEDDAEEEVEEDDDEESTLVCPLCRYSTTSLSSFQCHQAVHNRKDEMKVCPICLNRFESLKEVKIHIFSEHSNEDQSGCAIEGCMWKCMGSVVAKRNAFHKHVLRSHALSGFVFCEFCDYFSRSSSHLMRHLRIHNDERNFRCSMCESSFREKFKLKIHIDNVHLKVSKFKCQHCVKWFSSPWQLKSHVRSHNNETFNCKKCDKNFTKLQSLAGHVKSAHPELRHPKKLICESCGKRFRIRSLLEKHRCQNDYELVRCQICDKEVKVESLKAHLEYHNQKKQSCDFCNKVFSSKSSMQRHLLIHKNEKPFHCEICLKKFRQKSTLRTHVKIHSGERYSCSACDKRFISKGLLNHHFKISECNEEKLM